MGHYEASALGVALVLLGASVYRRVARTRLRLHAALALDLALPLVIFTLLATISGRPVFGGLVTLALCAGYAHSDRAKRATLQEPVVFTDVFQSFDIFRHPELALPFPNKGRVLAGVGCVLGAFVAAFWLEPRSWTAPSWVWLLVIAALCGLTAVLRRPVRGAALRWLTGLGASGDPDADAASLGPLAMHWVHALVAAGERQYRRAAAAPPERPVEGDGEAGPLVVVQSESFFDARRLHDSIDRGLLPNFDRACRDGVQWGRLTVPCWGANTVRTEFAVLSGLDRAALGFDHFNPYHRFADAPVDTLAWRMRARGYRTICLHPYDGSFYGRDRILGNLGFDELIDERAFGADAPRVEGYISDIEVARVTADLLLRHGPKVFVFVVTMENHGPWGGGARASSDSDCLALSMLPEPERHALRRYLSGLRHADAMLGTLRQTLERNFSNGTLVFYGDHLPGFPLAYRQLGLADRRSDYLIWRNDAAAATNTDLGASGLSTAILAGAQAALQHGSSAGTGLSGQTEARKRRSV